MKFISIISSIYNPTIGDWVDYTNLLFIKSSFSWEILKQKFNHFGQSKLFAVDGINVTVNKIITAIIIVLVGIILSKLITEFIRLRAISKTKLDEGASEAISNLLFYLFSISIFFFAMRTAGISLRVFAFLGGAVAIAVGFGAQNLLNNFISGLIIMIERPVKIGDLVEVDGRFGQISKIGARCSRISLFHGNDLMVPNSFLLEKNVINWTLKDKNVRSVIKLGVIYGSPTRKVEELLKKAASEHPRILENPPPRVLFTEFGDNSLNFEVHYWISLNHLMDRRIIPSEMHYRIDELFRVAGITIAFPQRDVHLDASKPLEIKMLTEKS